MGMRMLLLAAAGFIVVVTFQNCDRSSFQVADSASTSAQAVTVPSPTGTPPPSPAPPAAKVPALPVSGTVQLFRLADLGSDALLRDLENNNDMAKKFNDLFAYMVFYTPTYDLATFRFAKGHFYHNLYAIHEQYMVQNGIKEEWILRDAKGNKLYIPWGCSNGTCPAYAGNIWDPAYRKNWIDRARVIFDRSIHAGIFIDDSTLDFRTSDGNENHHDPVVNGKTMTAKDWAKAVADFTSEIRDAFPTKKITNNGGWTYGSHNDYSDEEVKRHLASGDYFLMEFGINDGGIFGGSGPYSVNQHLKFIAKAHSVGTGIILGNVPSEPVGREYGLAYYYLYKTEKDLLMDQSVLPNVDLWKGYTTDLGFSTGELYEWNGLRRRDFKNGVVLFNEPQASEKTVQIPGYVDLEGKSGPFTLAAKTGKILIKATK